jgi:micrococcal nuclease
MIDALPPAIVCEAPRAVDGDTLACANLIARIRLVGIDAPELPGHCRKGRECAPGDGLAARLHLTRLAARTPAIAYPAGRDKYGRILARVRFSGQDASCAMLAAGHAIPRYAPLRCRR